MLQQRVDRERAVRSIRLERRGVRAEHVEHAVFECCRPTEGFARSTPVFVVSRLRECPSMASETSREHSPYRLNSSPGRPSMRDRRRAVNRPAEACIVELPRRFQQLVALGSGECRRGFDVPVRLGSRASASRETDRLRRASRSASPDRGRAAAWPASGCRRRGSRSDRSRVGRRLSWFQRPVLVP